MNLSVAWEEVAKPLGQVHRDTPGTTGGYPG